MRVARLVVHGPALSEDEDTELLDEVMARPVGVGVVFVWSAESADDLVENQVEAHRAAAGREVAAAGGAVVYVAPGFDDERFVFAVDQVLTRLPASPGQGAAGGAAGAGRPGVGDPDDGAVRGHRGDGFRLG